MTSAPTFYPCPYCGAAASAVSGCPSCGRGPDPDAIEVIRLDAEIAGLHQRLQAARAQVQAVEAQLAETVNRRNVSAFRVGAAVRAATTPPATPARVTVAPAPATAPAGPPPESRLSTLTVQNVLFALGGMLLLVAAAVFTAVAWAQVGVAGRAALLGAATAAVLAVPPFAVRRGLTAAAETLAAVGLLMILLDGYAAWAVNFLGVQGTDPRAYAAAVCATTAAVALGYSRLVRIPGPRIAALVVAQPVLPLLAAAVDAGATVWSLALTGVTGLNVAVLRLRGRRFAFTGTGVVAYLCGAAASAGAGLAAVTGLVFADSAWEGAAAGGALVLVAAVLLGAAILAAHRVAQAVAGGLLVLAIGVAAGGWSLLLSTAMPELRLAVVALVIAALVAALRPHLPGQVARGPWIGALLVAGVPALAVALNTLAAAFDSADAARPPLEAPLTSTVSGSSWDLPVAAVTVALAYALLSPRRRRPDLALLTLATVGLLAPAAFGLPWWTAAILALIAGAVALGLAARARTGVPLLFRFAIAGATGLWAVITGAGNAGGEAGVFAAVTGIGIGTAFAARSGPRRADVGAAGLVAGLLAIAPAVWLALLALDTSTTVRVRAMLGVAVVLWSAAHAAARRLPEYGVHTLTVSVLFSAVLPVSAFAGSDPVSLYAAAALVLLASGAHTALDARPQPGGASQAAPGTAAGPGAGVTAGAAAGSEPMVVAGPSAGSIAVVGAVLPVLTLLAVTGFDLAAVFVEPYGALADFWSGDVPATSSVAWSTVAALLITAGAAWLTRRTRTALLATTPLLAVAVPLTFAAAGAPWPAATIAELVTGLAGLVALGLLPYRAGAASSAVIPGPARTSPSEEPPAAATAAGRPGAQAAGQVLTPADQTTGQVSKPADQAATQTSEAAGGTPTPAPNPAVIPTAGPATTPVPQTTAGATGATRSPATEPVPPASATDPSRTPAQAPGFAPPTPATAAAPGAAPWRTAAAVVFGALAVAGLAGTTPVRGAMLAGFALVLVASAVIGVAGRAEAARVAGWVTGSASVAVLAFTAASIAGLGTRDAAFAVLAAAAATAVLEWFLAARRPREAPAVAAVAHSGALVALLISGTAGRAAVVCVLWATVLAVRALREDHRVGYTIAAAATVLAGWWLLLTSWEVETVEVYTLPAAALALGAGWVARRGRPDLPSWTAYGPALAAGLLPTFAVISNSADGDPQYARRLLLGVAGLAVLILGARVRLQAPVVVGGGVLVLVALHELFLIWDLVPRWVPLAVGGVLLVSIATTMEQRRRDVLRLRAAVGRMG